MTPSASSIAPPSLTKEQALRMRQWFEALRSGHWPQASGTLCAWKHGPGQEAREEPQELVGFCCLGVAVELAARDGCPILWDRRHLDATDDSDTSDTLLIEPVIDWYGFDSEDAKLFVPCHQLGTRDEDHCGQYRWPEHSVATCLNSVRVTAVLLNDRYAWPFPRIADAFEAYYFPGGADASQ